jgi:hypothetical protein
MACVLPIKFSGCFSHLLHTWYRHFICFLFIVYLKMFYSNLDRTALSGLTTVNNELELRRKEVTEILFEAFRVWSKPQKRSVRESVTWLGFKPETSLIKVSSLTRWGKMLDSIDCFSISCYFNCRAPNGRMNTHNELKRIWKEVA